MRSFPRGRRRRAGTDPDRPLPDRASAGHRRHGHRHAGPRSGVGPAGRDQADPSRVPARPAMVRTFLREAHHMARMGILTSSPFSRDLRAGRRPFYVMPYLARGSLSVGSRRALPRYPCRVPIIAREVADALRYAHGVGIIHRDIKPSNILIADDGRACLADFGLVRTVYNDTISGDVRNWCVGTPCYMSPAVAAGQPEDTRCDIYSFGALLYAMLAGQPPYGGRAARPSWTGSSPVPRPRSDSSTRRHRPTLSPSPKGRWPASCATDTPAWPISSTTSTGPRRAGPLVGPRGGRPPAAVMSRRCRDGATRSRVPVTRFHGAPFSPAGRRGPLVVPRESSASARLARPIPESPSRALRPRLTINALSVAIYRISTTRDAAISSAWPFAPASYLTRVEADLAAPAVCCLLELTPRGTVEICYPPATAAVAAAEVTKLAIPSDTDFLSLAEDGRGLAAFVLVAWRKPANVSPEAVRGSLQEKWAGITSMHDDDSGDLGVRRRVLPTAPANARGGVVPGPEAARLRWPRRAGLLASFPGVEAIRRGPSPSATMSRRGRLRHHDRGTTLQTRASRSMLAAAGAALRGPRRLARVPAPGSDGPTGSMTRRGSGSRSSIRSRRSSSTPVGSPTPSGPPGRSWRSARLRSCPGTAMSGRPGPSSGPASAWPRCRRTVRSECEPPGTRACRAPRSMAEDTSTRPRRSLARRSRPSASPGR